MSTQQNFMTLSYTHGLQFKGMPKSSTSSDFHIAQAFGLLTRKVSQVNIPLHALRLGIPSKNEVMRVASL